MRQFSGELVTYPEIYKPRDIYSDIHAMERFSYQVTGAAPLPKITIDTTISEKLLLKMKPLKEKNMLIEDERVIEI